MARGVLRTAAEVVLLARVLLLSCLFPSTAFAGSSGSHATLVGLGSFGGEVALGVGGAVTGAAIGASTCGDAFECWSPLIGASLGFASGVAAGGFVGTGVSAHLTHERAGRALLGSTLGLGAGVGVMALGVASSSGEVMLLGVGVAVVGVPVGGAIAVATDRHVAVLPDVRRDGGGLRITGTF